MKVAAAILTALLGAGCFVAVPDVQTPEVSGVYQMTVEGKENGCAFPEWTEGPLATAGEISILQDKTEPHLLTARLGGWFALIGFGTFTTDLEGRLAERKLTLTLFSLRSETRGQCSYALKLTATADYEVGSKILKNGEVAYTFTTNGSKDCAELATCRSRQTFRAVWMRDVVVTDAGGL